MPVSTILGRRAGTPVESRFKDRWGCLCLGVHYLGKACMDVCGCLSQGVLHSRGSMRMPSVEGRFKDR